MALRFDRGTLRAPRELGDGTFIVDAVITRAGVFEYRRHDGSIQREYRSPKEVFKPASMASFEHMAVTFQHPREGLVTIENRSELGKGTVVGGSVRRDGNELVASLHITDRSLFEAMRSGTNAISCGYNQDFVATPGTSPEGERHDGEQTNIEGNHVAIVDIARAGDSARARMDSATMISTGASPESEKNTMFKTIEEATAAYHAEKIRADAATGAMNAANVAVATEKKRADGFEAERDAAKEAAAKSDKLRVDGEKTAMASARARVTLEAVATKVLRTDGADAPSFDGKTDRQIKESVIVKLTGKALPEGKSADYIDARYDTAIESESEASEAAADVVLAVDQSGKRNDTKESDSKKARDEMIARGDKARTDHLKQYGKGA